MEKSKLVSLIIAKLKLAYPYFFEKLSDEEFLGLVNLYQEELGDCDYTILSLTIKYLIRNSKYMPSLADILIEYRNKHKEIFVKLIENSSIDNKNYLKNMVEWYSYKDDYPNNIPKEIKNEIQPLLQQAIEFKKTKLIESRN